LTDEQTRSLINAGLEKMGGVVRADDDGTIDVNEDDVTKDEDDFVRVEDDEEEEEKESDDDEETLKHALNEIRNMRRSIFKQL
jgi:hypothetical protein